MMSAQQFELRGSEYFNCEGVDVMAFSDFYPEGHQGGLCIIMHGNRVATNGDIRLEATPGQWQPVPRQLHRQVDASGITTTLCYPDSSRHMTGFNPMIYPELQLTYSVRVQPKGRQIEVFVDLESPIPDALIGKAGFNLEFFPGALFGKPWIMDQTSGIYPQQPNAPLLQTSPNILHTGHYHQEGKPMYIESQFVGDGQSYSPIIADDVIASPYAVGRKFTSRPDDPLNRADWSYIPGGVVSGTALIRPDFPELLTFPFLWQQTEYVLGGGSSHYMFLVLAVQDLMKNQ